MTKTAHIDPEIQDIIEILNEEGLETEFSCAGHPKTGGPYDRGYITFAREYSPVRVRRILEQLGLKVGEIRSPIDRFSRTRKTEVRFVAIGQ